MIDPLDSDPTKIRVTEWRVVPCGYHERYIESKAVTDRCKCSCAGELCTTIVPAKMITEPCPHCFGSGTVQRKVRADEGTESVVESKHIVRHEAAIKAAQTRKANKQAATPAGTCSGN